MISINSMFFFFNDTATTEIYTLSLHDALPICLRAVDLDGDGDRPDADLHRVGEAHRVPVPERRGVLVRSEEHTSERQSPCNLVCRLLLEKKEKKSQFNVIQISHSEDR